MRIRGDGGGGVYVEGLSEHVVRTTDEIYKLMHQGAHMRTTAETKLNKVSRMDLTITISVLCPSRKVVAVMQFLQLLWNMLYIVQEVAAL